MAHLRAVRGFTLLELMAVAVIVAILATVSMPFYYKYVQQSQRGAAESQMLKMAADLEHWRSKALTYKGFVPSTGYGSTSSITALTNAVVYVPQGSTAANYTYQIVILDDTNRSQSLATGIGQGWVMVAQPNTTNAILQPASRLVLNNQGVRCLTDQNISDATMKANIISTTLDDASLCTSPSSAW